MAAKRRWIYEYLMHGAILLALLMFVFPGVMRGRYLSPAEALFGEAPWKYYKPAHLEVPPHKLMSDVMTAFRPYYVLTRRALDNGEWPLWNDLEMFGMPLLANGQSAPLYPPRLLHAFLNISLATTLYHILKLWLCGMTAYICGRGLGLGKPSSRLLSFGWMLASYNVIWCSWSLSDVSAWVPIMFLGLEWVLAGRYRRGFYTFTTGAALVMLAGHPETAFTFCLGMGLYFAARLLFEKRTGERLWKPALILCGAWAATLPVCAGQLLPFVEYLANSATFFDRPATELFALSPGAAVSFFLPRFFGASVDGNYWGEINSNLYSMIYPGVAIWVCAALLFARGRTAAETAPPRTGLDVRAGALLASAAFELLLAFNAPTIGALHQLPVINTLRHCYHVCWPLFALPMLAAMGLDHWSKRERGTRDLLWILPPAAIGAAIVLTGRWFFGGLIDTMRMAGYIDMQILTAAVLVLLCAAALAICGRFSRPWLAGNLIALLLAMDLIYAGRGLNPSAARENVFPPTKITSYLQSLGRCRIGITEGDIPQGLFVSYGLEDWVGYDGLYPGRIMRLFKRLGPKMWDNFEPVRAIPYFLHDTNTRLNIPPERMKQMEVVATVDGYEVCRNPRALPRAFLVGKARVVPNFDDMMAAMCAPNYDPAREALVESLPPGKIPNADVADLGAAKIVEQKSTRIAIEAEAKQDCLLVLSDNWYPGWTAAIDGAATPVFPAYYILRAIILPAGKHTVVFRYMPTTFKAGMGISVAALLLLSSASLIQPRKRLAPSPSAGQG